MVEVTPNAKPTKLPSKGRIAKGHIGNRILDGRALPFASLKNKEVIAGEISIIPGSKKNVFVISNGKSVSAYVINNESVALWPNTHIMLNLKNNNIADKYLVETSDNNHKIYCNNSLIYTLENEIKTPEMFIKLYGNRFTKTEQKVIYNGGLLVRGLRDSTNKLISGKLISSKLFEIERKTK